MKREISEIEKSNITDNTSENTANTKSDYKANTKDKEKHKELGKDFKIQAVWAIVLLILIIITAVQTCQITRLEKACPAENNAGPSAAVVANANIAGITSDGQNSGNANNEQVKNG